MAKHRDSLRGYAFPIHKRDNFRCRYCGLDGRLLPANWLSLSWDHLLPKGHPNRNNPDYIVTACMFCNTADNQYFRHAAKRNLSFDGLAPEQLVAQRLRYVEVTRKDYLEFWEQHVRPKSEETVKTIPPNDNLLKAEEVSMADDVIAKLQAIKDRFFSLHTNVPQAGRCKELDDNGIWKGIVTQIMVVGGSRPVEERFDKSAELQDRISYTSLSRIQAAERPEVINRVLRDTGIRYASSELVKCWKTRALALNFKVVQDAAGPKAFIETISIQDDQTKIHALQSQLKGFKSKSARDFLMSHGLLENALALDIRVTNVLSALGVPIDIGIKTSEKVYAREEARLLSNLCGKLGMKGIEFDRMIYQNYAEIKRLLKLGALAGNLDATATKDSQLRQELILTVPNRVNVKLGTERAFPVIVRRENVEGGVVVDFEPPPGPPAGITLNQIKIHADESYGQASVTVGPQAQEQPFAVKITGRCETVTATHQNMIIRFVS